MTQAFNLALLANNVNSSGQLNADSGLYNTVNVANGGTNLSATPTNGQLLIGNGTGYTLATLTAGAGISISNASGEITLTFNLLLFQ
jgi:trimeric autotransporter adhesin